MQFTYNIYDKVDIVGCTSNGSAIFEITGFDVSNFDKNVLNSINTFSLYRNDISHVKIKSSKSNRPTDFVLSDKIIESLVLQKDVPSELNIISNDKGNLFYFFRRLPVSLIRLIDSYTCM